MTMNDNTDKKLNSFSFSAISTFESCRRAFEYRYIKKLPEAFNSIEAYMGTCVHETLEWAYTQRQEGYEPNLQEALEQYNQTWNNGDLEFLKIVKEDKTRGDYYSQGRECVVYYFNTIFPNDNSETLFLEQQFQIPMAAKDGEVIYRGVIDRIAKETNGTIRVTDYKTGKVDHPTATLQLPSYALYIFQHNIDNEIQLCYEDLKEERTMVVPFTRKDARIAKEELINKIEVIRCTDKNDFHPTPSILCQWCGYNQICDKAYNPKKANYTNFIPPRPSTPGSGKKANGDVINNSNGPNANNGTPNDEYQEGCPQCGSPLKKRNGKFGPFLGCTNYPQCRYTRDLGGGQGYNAGENNETLTPTNNPSASAMTPARDPEIEGKDICPECGSLLKKRKGKFGEFMGCSSFPQCRFTRQL
jgi:ssDNA-binding Zn-finger/Zn-ribbon topoisomerase 1/RecB family exonuclease